MDGLAEIVMKEGCTMEQLWASDVSMSKPGSQVPEWTTLKKFVRSTERLSTNGSSRKLEKQCADLVRRFLATVLQTVYPDIISKEIDKSHGIQRRELPKRNKS